MNAAGLAEAQCEELDLHVLVYSPRRIQDPQIRILIPTNTVGLLTDIPWPEGIGVNPAGCESSSLISTLWRSRTAQIRVIASPEGSSVMRRSLHQGPKKAYT